MKGFRFLLGFVGLLSACASPETKVLAPYTLANGNTYQDVISVGANGNGTSPTVTTITTYALSCPSTQTTPNGCSDAHKPVAISSGSQNGTFNTVISAVGGGATAAGLAHVLVKDQTINNAATANATTTGSTGGGTTTTSDIRLKRDIHQVGILSSGIKIYSFKYKHLDNYAFLDTRTTFVGVMAQDVLNSEFSNAVQKDENGYYRVDYGKIGFEMMTLDKWESLLSVSPRGATS